MNKKVFIFAIGLIIAISFMVISTQNKEPILEQQEFVPAETAQELYEEAITFKKNHNKLKAKKVYRRMIADYSDFENIESVQKELEILNIEIITSNIPTPQTIVYEVKIGDTLGKLAKKYKTTIELIKKKNNLRNNIIRIGQRLIVWTGTFNIFVDKSQNMLILKNKDEVVKTYTVSTGRESNTPIGEYTIESKLIDPVWFNRGVVVPADSPQNVLGSRWIGFDLPGYGIHGTIHPETIGSHETAGCVRMRNEDVEEIYSMVPIGIKVVIVD